jgi:cytochrome c oxidase cbb3-type subunit 3
MNNNSFIRYIRVTVLFFAFWGLLEYFIESGDRPALIRYPIMWLVLAVFLIFILTIEFVVAVANRLVYVSMSEEQRTALAADSALPLRKKAWYKNMIKKLTRSEPMENESLLLLDHNYDGIRELDNNLPPWWLYLFYGGILFGAVYLVRYEILDGDNQEMEFSKEMAQAKRDVEEYKKHAPDLMDEKKVTQLTDAVALQKGKSIFESNCAACHRADGGGQIGPNLTDQYWIFGGDVKTIFHTITNGGRDGKGMVSWKGTLKPTEIQYAASYIMSLQGTNPKDAKAPDGELSTAENSAVIAKPATIK